MKKLLFVCFCLMATSLQAQTWWGYWNTSMPREESTEALSGTTHCAIRITPDNALLIDGRIHGVRFWLSDKSVVTEASIWVSFRQFGSGGEPDMAVKTIAADDLKDLKHDGEPTVAMFDAPVDVLPASNRYANAYVGYTIRTSAACRMITAGRDISMGGNTCFINWEHREAYDGPLALQLMVSGKRIGECSVAASPFDEQILSKGDMTAVGLNLRSEGEAAVSSLDYEISIDGAKHGEGHVDLSQKMEELGVPFTLPVDVRLPDEPRRYNCEVKITRVNGEPNENAQPAASGALIALSQMPLKRTVMEELTGTWCPNCPRGLVGMHLLEQTYGDRFVGIAIHGGDSTEPMRLADYDGSSFARGVINRMGGRPSCAVDRTIDCDPYGGVGLYYEYGADVVVDWALQQKTVADMDVTARYADAAQTAIDVDVATTFRYSADVSPYQLMLVLTADSLTGEGDEWLQVNTLVGKTEYDAACDEFVNGERRMRLKYNHVPVYVDGVENGIEGSIAHPLAADEPQHYTRRIDISRNELVQRKECVHAVAMLIDTRTGVVLNVAKGHVEGATDDISNIRRDAIDAPRYYDLQGRPLPSPTRGLMIERTADGLTRKVMR